MSVGTEADRNLSDAREHIQAAIACMASIVVGECHGSDDFKDVFKGTLRDCMNSMLIVRDRIK